MVSAEDVLRQEDDLYTHLLEAIGAVTVDRRTAEGVVPGWSTHDVLWHVTYWVGHASTMLEQASFGPPFPDEPEEGAYYDARNAEEFATGRELTWDQVTARLSDARRRLRSALEAAPDAARPWMSERAMEEVQHYRVHAAQIRAFSGHDRRA